MPELRLLASPKQLEIQPGDRGVVTLVVQNRTGFSADYRLLLQGIASTWATLGADSNSPPLRQMDDFLTRNSQSSPITVTVQPPLAAPAGVAPLVLRAVSRDNETEMWGEAVIPVSVVQTAQAPVETAAGASPAGVGPPPTASPSAPTLSAPPETSGQILVTYQPKLDSQLAKPAQQYELTITNASRNLDHFYFSFSGPAGRWASLDALTLPIDGGKSARNTLSIEPPPDALAGVYDLIVTTYSADEPDNRTQLRIPVTIERIVRFDLRTVDTKLDVQGITDFVVEVTTRPEMNVRTHLDFSQIDPKGLADYTWTPPSVYLGRNRSVRVRLTAAPKFSVQPGAPPPTTEFQVVATARESGERVVSPRVLLALVPPIPPLLRLSPKRVTTDLEGATTVSVVNVTDTRLSLLLTAKDDGEVLRYDPQTAPLDLAPHEEKQVKLRISAPSRNEARPGDGTVGPRTYGFTVEATRPGDKSPLQTAQGEFVQTEWKDVEIQINPREQPTTDRAVYEVMLKNPRREKVDVTLQARDEEGALRPVNFTPRTLKLSPEAQATSTLVMASAVPLKAGDVQATRSFEVSAAVEGSQAPRTEKAKLFQQPGFRWRTAGRFGLTGGAVIVGLLFIIRFFVALNALAHTPPVCRDVVNMLARPMPLFNAANGVLPPLPSSTPAPTPEAQPPPPGAAPAPWTPSPQALRDLVREVASNLWSAMWWGMDGLAYRAGRLILTRQCP